MPSYTVGQIIEELDRRKVTLRNRPEKRTLEPTEYVVIVEIPDEGIPIGKVKNYESDNGKYDLLDGKL